MMRSPIRPIAIPRASGAVSVSATLKKRRPNRRMLTAFAIVAPAMPPRREIPPFQTSSHSIGEAKSDTWAITYATRAPTIAPIRDQKTIEFTASTEIPRRPASRPNNQAPVANPMAMNTPWGEKPNTRSTTGQPTEASDGLIRPSVTACSRTTAGPEPRDRASEEQPTRHVARVVHAQRDPRRANDHVQRGERRADRCAQPQLAGGHPREGRQHRGVGRRPRGPLRSRDQEPGPRRVGVGRPRPDDDALDALQRQPGRAGGAERAERRPAPSGCDQHAGGRPPGVEGHQRRELRVGAGPLLAPRRGQPRRGGPRHQPAAPPRP